MKAGTQRSILITGGAGFIGSNLAAELLRDEDTCVQIFDNLSRPGVELNLKWLREQAGWPRLTITSGDVRNAAQVRTAAADATEIYHFAAQVAVTTSVADPVSDCETNVLGTLNVLEAARRSRRNPFVLFTSTNKVYGGLPGLDLVCDNTRYRFKDPGLTGVNEAWPLDFHSPYGCSKGAADQYVRDYARIYDLPTVVFRMSCIAGPRQLGTEDQGWVAHFLYSALEQQPVTIYGDGRQVRDVLHVHDLVRAMRMASEQRETTAGNIYNVGGGITQAISVREAIEKIEQLTGEPIECEYAETRPGDQNLYITDYSRLQKATGWRPRRSVDTILADIAAFWNSGFKLYREEQCNALHAGRVA